MWAFESCQASFSQSPPGPGRRETGFAVTRDNTCHCGADGARQQDGIGCQGRGGKSATRTHRDAAKRPGRLDKSPLVAPAGSRILVRTRKRGKLSNAIGCKAHTT
jgi:hypothetical protein